jgi:hypothetical protein
MPPSFRPLLSRPARSANPRPDTPNWKLEASLRCRHCTEALRGRRPAANIVRLREEKTLEFEAWYQEGER